jgi:hypothetical protein
VSRPIALQPFLRDIRGDPVVASVRVGVGDVDGLGRVALHGALLVGQEEGASAVLVARQVRDGEDDAEEQEWWGMRNGGRGDIRGEGREKEILGKYRI